MSYDVIVLGAGVAGSVVAAHLAGVGARVALVGKATPGGWEGLSERSMQALELAGHAGLTEQAARHGHWGLRSVQGREWIVARAALAAVLTERAVQAGADPYRGAGQSPRLEGSAWQVELQDGRRLTGGWLVEARGRRGAARCGPRLLAVAQRYRLKTSMGAVTYIAPFSGGWCWWARHGDEAWVQVTRDARAGSPHRWFLEAAQELPSLSALLHEAQPVGALSARPAHARLAPPMAALNAWRVGDAAWALDPLSGQGVYEAVRGARLVATAIGGVLQGGDPVLAQRFVHERHDAAFQRAVAIAMTFYRENAALGSFWTRTAALYQSLIASPVSSPPLRLERRPVLLDGRVVEREVMITPEHPRGVWQIGGVPLAGLFRRLQEPGSLCVETTAHQLGHPARAVRDAVRWIRERADRPRRMPSSFNQGV